MSKFYYAYVLKSLKTNQLYIGCTNNLIERVKKHNKGLVFATKSETPLKLVYYEACLSKVNAIEREKTLKTGFGRKYLKRRIGNV